MSSPAGGDEFFGRLSDADKVAYSKAETAATLAHLDKLIAELDGLRAGVDDPDGLISCVLGFDGRLLELRIADAVGEVLTNLELEKRLNTMLASGTDGVDAMRSDLFADADANYEPPQHFPSQ